MKNLSLVYAPNEIFRKKTEDVSLVDDSVRQLIDMMLNALYRERGIGLGANMLGILKSIAIVDLQENGVNNPYIFINPKITWHSNEMQVFREASLCFPGIDAEITRPNAIKVSYLDYDGNAKELEASGFFATVIQHEVDYLNGKIFLDYLSKLKRDTLLKKTEKYIKMHPPHVHGEHCNH